MIRRLLRKLPLLLWFVPGFLLWASFPPMREKIDAFFALAPIIWFARRNAPGRSFRCWFVNGLFFWIATLSWMPAIVKNGGPWPLVVLGWFALAAYCALYFGAFGCLSSIVWRWTRPRGYGWRLAAILVAEPVLWSGLEIIRSRLLGGFAWNQLGVAPVNAGLGSPAVLGGVYLVSAVVMLVNGTFASIAERMLAQFLPADGDGKGPPRWARSVETLLPFLVVFGLYGLSSSVQGAARSPGAGAGSEPLRVGLVQRCFPCVFQPAESREETVAAYEGLFGLLAPLRPDLLVLSESAMSEFGALDSANARAFARWATAKGNARALLSGGIRREDGRTYNSAGLYQVAAGDGGDVAFSAYDKVHLVPFGEYIPGDKVFPALQKLAPVGSCTPGEPRVLELSRGGAPVRIGVGICFEDTDSALVREQAALGAQLLVFITNDSWFYGSAETEQHAWQAVARAVETGLPVVRVGNSGVTGVVRPGGAFSFLAGRDGGPLVDARGTMGSTVSVPADPRRTPYVVLGDAPIFCAFLLLIMSMGLVKYKHDHELRRKVSM